MFIGTPCIIFILLIIFSIITKNLIKFLIFETYVIFHFFLLINRSCLGGGGNLTAAPCIFSYNLQVKKYWSESLRLLKFSDFFQIQIALLFRSETEDFNTNCISPQAHCLNAYILQKFFCIHSFKGKLKSMTTPSLKLWVKCCKCAEENITMKSGWQARI